MCYQLLAVARLDNALKASGQTAGSSKLIALADDLQKITPFADDATLSMMAMMAAMGFTESEIAQLTPTVQDLSVAFGKDLTSTAQAVGRAIKTESAGALTRFGIVVDESVMKTGDLNVILGELSKTSKGAAEAAGKELGGQLAITKNLIGDMGEAIGGALAPALQQLLPIVQGVAGSAKALAESGAGKALIVMGTAASIAVAGFGALVTVATPVIRGILAIRAALISVAVTAQTTAATVSASAAEMAVATNAAGLAVGVGQVGTGLAIGKATAGMGAGILLRRGAGAVGRFVAGKGALGYAGPIGLAAGIGLTGYELYAAGTTARSEQQIADIEGAPYNALQQANMARWSAGRTNLPMATSLNPGAIAGQADVASLESEIWGGEGSASGGGQSESRRLIEQLRYQWQQGEISSQQYNDALYNAAQQGSISGQDAEGAMRFSPISDEIYNTMDELRGLASEGRLPSQGQMSRQQRIAWGQMSGEERKTLGTGMLPEPTVYGIAPLGGGAFQLPGGGEPGYARALRSGGLGRIVNTAQGVTVSESRNAAGERELLIRVQVADDVPPGILTDGVTDWMNELQYADAGVL